MMSIFMFPDVPIPQETVRHAVASIARRVHRGVPDRIDHPSGRPWVIGDLSGLRVIISTEASAAMMLESSTQEPESRLRSRLDHAVRSGGERRLLADIGGDGLFGLRRDGYQLVAGSVSGHRRIFTAGIKTTGIEDTMMVGDSAIELASFLGLTVSAERIAMCLCESLPFHPFASAPLWKEIGTVAHHSALEYSQGRSREVRWWHLPRRQRQSGASADRVRSALMTALAHAVSDVHAVTADLSGGLDSTSIVYALHALGVSPTTFHGRSVNHRNTDALWAQRAAADLNLELLEMPGLGTSARAFALDAAATGRRISDYPAVWWGSSGYVESLAQSMRTDRAAVHFTGIGGDELFGPLPAMLWSVAREGAAAGFPAIRRAASYAGISLPEALRVVFGRRSFGSVLEAEVQRLAAGVECGQRGLGQWFPPLSFGGLLSAHGRALALSGLREILGAGQEPLDQDRGRHQMLEFLQFQGRVIAQIQDAFPARVRWESPYLRRAVIEAASSAPASERYRPDTVKPVLAAAMVELGMPKEFFERPVSGDYTADTYAEFRVRRQGLIATVGESQLAAMEIIDAESVTRRILEPAPSPEALSEIEALVSVERWLRQVVSMGSSR